MPIRSPILPLSSAVLCGRVCARASLCVTDSVSEVLRRWHTYTDTKPCTRIRWCGDDDDVYSAVCYSAIIKWLRCACVCICVFVCLFDYIRCCCSACLIKDREPFQPFNIQHQMHGLIIVSVADNYIWFFLPWPHKIQQRNLLWPLRLDKSQIALAGCIKYTAHSECDKD